MPKILWVALPLLLAAAVLAVQVLRRRAPSRHAINIGASVLLLAYVATTAGLGIFWVANQQLPVFDWHYLFGYGTVLLVSLHLVFNLPVVWRFFARQRGPTVEARRGALGMLGALGVLAATGAAFVLGLRHGRSELKIDTPAGPTAATALAIVERFHAFSSHSRAGLLARAPGVDWGDPPPSFKRHAGAVRMRLPPAGAARRTAFDVAALADVLWHTAGVTDTRGGLALRASPSSGALFSTELYVAARGLPGLASGLWHYESQSHAIERLGEAAAAELLFEATADTTLHGTTALVVATAIFRRTGHKYRDRTYRYVLADLGHALENLRVAAGSLGMQAHFVTAFDEASVAQTLGVDETEEGVLALIALGARNAGAAPATAPTPHAGTPSASRWRPAAPLAAHGAALGVTAAVHAATSLRSATPPSPASASASAAMPPPSLQELVTLPSAEAAAPDWLRVIATRRSVRRYAAAALPLPALATVLSHMTRDGPMLSPAVRVNVIVHAVVGLAPGAYRYESASHALVPRRVPLALRDAARAAALDQDVIGDAAAVFVLSIDRAAFAADPLGPARGYRHAFLEAGLVGERIYLEAGLRRLGACAVGAFYDDEAAALVGVDPAREWVLHFAALGPRA